MFGDSVPADDSTVCFIDSKGNIYECKRHSGYSEDRDCVRSELAWKSSDVLSVWDNDPACVLA